MPWSSGVKNLKFYKSFPGGDGRRVTPVPISNTEVKPSSADGTALETVWESRTLPGFYSKPDLQAEGRVFSY